MKKSETISLIIIFLVLAAIFAGAIYLGSMHRFGSKTSASEPTDATLSKLPNHLYCQIDGVMMRFDPKNDSVEKLCGHTDEDVYCILEHTAPPTRISDGRVYFGYLSEDAKYYIAYYDIESGKTHQTGIELSVKKDFFVYDGYIYFIDLLTITRVPVDGGEPEKLTECSPSEGIFTVADGKIYTYSDKSSVFSSIINTEYIYSYDIKSLEKKELFEFKVSNFNNNIINNAKYLDGMIYFTLDTSEMVPTSSALVVGRGRYLYAIDTRTEECNKLLDTEVDEFFIDENKIYYFPPADPTVGYFYIARSNDIHECDLDGKNDRVIYSNSDIVFLGGDIVNRKLFGSFAGYIPGINSDVFYASLDLETGEIKEVVLPE
jgi:hypothetical protein